MKSMYFNVKVGLPAAVVLLTAVLAFSAGCAKPEANQSPQSSDQGTVAVEWSMQSDCTVCHSDQAASMSNSQCLTSKHSQVACTTCHADESTLSNVHKDAKSASTVTSLSKTTVPSSVCLSCHDKTQLIAATANVTVCTDSQGKTVNPHDLPVNDKHATINCTDCHKMHTTDSADTLAPDLCLSCHHKDVYECGTCHQV